MNEEQKKKFDVVYARPKLTPDGYAMVCPRCKDDGELGLLDLAEALADPDYPNDGFALPNQGPGGYHVVDITKQDEYVQVDANWRELGVFSCGNCGWVGSANHIGKQLVDGYSSSSRGYYRDTKGLTIESGTYWHEVQGLFGYTPYVEGPNDDVEMIIKFEGPRDAIEGIWTFLLNTDPHVGFGFPDVVVNKMAEYKIGEGL